MAMEHALRFQHELVTTVPHIAAVLAVSADILSDVSLFIATRCMFYDFLLLSHRIEAPRARFLIFEAYGL